MRRSNLLLLACWTVLTVSTAFSETDLADKGKITVGKESYVFKGKAIKPKVVVSFGDKKLRKNKDYALSYEKNDAIGWGVVTATGKGEYTGSIEEKFLITPRPVKLKKVKKNDSGFDASWKAATDADGYELEYGTSSSFSDSSVNTIEGSQNDSFRATNLEPNTKYYIRLRSYKTVGGSKCYSAWSKTVAFLASSHQAPIAKGTYLVINLASGPTSSKYPISYLNSPPPGGWTEDYKTTKMVFRLVPAGTFMMGSPDTEKGHIAAEKQHLVTLTRPFYVGVFEVTQRQYALIMGAHSAEYLGTTRPVDNVSFSEIRGKNKGNDWPKNNDVDEDSFLGKLRVRTNELFELPTEAQWEYACRAKTTTALNSGTDLEDSQQDSNMDVLGRYKYNGGTDWDENHEYKAHAEVGSYIPNAWGLYDMHGNVGEAILDWDGTYNDGPEVDPVGSTTKTSHKYRGGSWSQPARGCRSASRGAYYIDGQTGFRLVLVQ